MVCGRLLILWGIVSIQTQANEITSNAVVFTISLTQRQYCSLLTMVDSGLGSNHLERPVGFIDDSTITSKTGFTVKNFSEANTGLNSYRWLVIGV